MRRILSFFMACLLAGACSEPILPDGSEVTSGEEPLGFKGVIMDESADFETRWSKGDRISINGNAWYTSFHDDTAATVFVCSGHEVSPAETSPRYEAFWPYTIAYTDEWNGISLSLPVNQTFTEAEEVRPPMYAFSDTEELNFRYLTGVLCLEVSLQSDSLSVRRISLSASKALSGRFSISEGKAVMDGVLGSTRMTIEREIEASSPLMACFNIPEGSYEDMNISIEAENGAVMDYPLESVLEIRAGRKNNVGICINPEDFVPDNCIYYTSTDGQVITPYGMEPLSNVYEDGIGVMTFGASLTTIKSDAFRNAEGYCTDASRLSEIRLPKTVKSIGNYAFEYCTALKRFRFPENALYTSVAASMFNGCTSLEGVHIPDNVTKINNNAFMNCTALKEVRLPAHIDKIPQNTFNGCTSLKKINIPDSLSVIGVKAFMGTAIEEFRVPAAVAALESQTFQDCTSLKILKIMRYGPDGEITLLKSKNTLKNCTALESIIVPAGSVETYANAENWSNHAALIKSAEDE